MHESSDARSSYLALALASRKALHSLDDYIEQGKKDEQFEDTVKEVIASLQATKATRDALHLFGPVPKVSPFTNYEQLLTLEEVVSDLKDQNVIENLASLLAPDPNEESRRRNANEAVKFFYTLENRALHHYSRQIGYREP
jgi:hypothetical protein